MVFNNEKSKSKIINKHLLMFIFIIVLSFTLIISVSATDSTIDSDKTSGINDSNIKASVDISSRAQCQYNIYSNMTNDEIQNIIDKSSKNDTIQFVDKNYNNISLIINKPLQIISNKGSTIYTLNSLTNNSRELGLINSFGFYFTNNSSGSIIKGLAIIGKSDYELMINGADNINIINNTISGGEISGIYITHTKYSLIKNNTIKNSKDGLNLNNFNRSTIVSNKIFSNKDSGIKLVNGVLNNISSNKIYKNSLDGILLEDVKANNILKNNISNNGVSGIRLEGFTIRNKIMQNNISNNVINIYANSITDNDIITKNILMYAKKSSNTYTTEDNTGSAIFFADNYTAAKNGAMTFAYNTVGFNDQWDAKSTMSHPAVDIGSNWYFDNDGNYAIGHICPMVFGGSLSPEDLKHLSMGFSKNGTGLIGQLFEGNTATGAGEFTIDNINIDGKDYGSATVNSDGTLSINTESLSIGSKVTITINGHSFEVSVDREVLNTNPKEDNQNNSSTNANNNANNKQSKSSNPNNSEITGNGTGSGFGSNTGIGSGDNNFTGTGISLGENSGETNKGNGDSGENGGGSASDSAETAYQIVSKKVSSTTAKNSQWLALFGVAIVMLIIGLGYRKKDNNDFNDDYNL